MDNGANWGEQRLAARTAARRRRSRWLVIGMIGIAAGIPFVAGFIDGFLGAAKNPDAAWIAAASVVGWIAIMAAAMWLHWRDLDEIQRMTTVRSLAAAGLVAVIFPAIVVLTKPFIAFDAYPRLGWGLAIAAGLVTHVALRIREWRA